MDFTQGSADSAKQHRQGVIKMDTKNSLEDQSINNPRNTYDRTKPVASWKNHVAGMQAAAVYLASKGK